MSVAAEQLSDATLRRVIYTALFDKLPQEKVMEALCIWEEYYKTEIKSDLGIIAFSNDIAKKFEVNDAQKSQIRIAMYRNLLPGADLEEDPIQALNAYRREHGMLDDSVLADHDGAKQSQGIQTDNPVFTVFCLLMRELISSGIAKGTLDQVELRNGIKAELLLTGFPPGLIYNLNKFFENEFVLVDGIFEMTADQMGSVVNVAYTLLCEFLGPVETDKLLTVTIEKVAALPEAADYDPRNFL